MTIIDNFPFLHAWSIVVHPQQDFRSLLTRRLEASSDGGENTRSVSTECAQWRRRAK
jgi:hypothetical protein